jgi:hypothetical protein
MVIAVLARDARRKSADLNSAKNLIVGCTSIVSNFIYIFSGLVYWPYVIALCWQVQQWAEPWGALGNPDEPRTSIRR